MIKVILFDLDGTLVNTLPLYIKAYDKALKNFGFTFDDEKIAQVCFNKTEALICKKLGIPNKTKEFAALYFSGVDAYFDEAKLFDNVLEVLDLINEKQFKLGIISFAYRWHINSMLEKLDLNKYFELVISFEDVTMPKPNPEAVLTACEKLGAKPHESMVIGDSKNDMLMGKTAEAKTILFHPKNYDLFYDLNDLRKSKPNNIVQNFQEIEQIILSLD